MLLKHKVFVFQKLYRIAKTYPISDLLMKLQFDMVLCSFLGIKIVFSWLILPVQQPEAQPGEGQAFPISLSMKMLNKKNTTFLALLRLFLFCTEMD